MRISYENFVLVSVCHNPVPIGAQVRPRLLVFTLWYLRAFSILWQNFMPLGEGSPYEWEGEKRHPLKKALL